MSLSLTQSYTAVAVGLPVSFLAIGGTGPFIYSVLPGGAGGTINPSTGLYTAPAVVSSDPATTYDTIQVVDSLAAIATARVLVGSALLLFCEIIQRCLGLADGRTFLWDQKIMQPTDSGLYVAVSVPSCKPFSNINSQMAVGGVLNSVQTTNMQALVDVDIISRGPAARDRKEEVILAFNSTYAQQQQEANSFYIGKLPPGSRMINLSDVDGAAIPYRYKISVQLQYAFTKIVPIQYYDQFSDSIATNA